jgi:protein-S-isoprenylcysteine O-methyltransferase Ste14
VTRRPREEIAVFVFVRAVVYASLFIGFFLVYVPASLLARVGIATPPDHGLSQLLGAVFAGAGAVLALWCVFTFASRGRGTPAPFDPPRLLVVVGPYRHVRNPMYIGAVGALLGAALYWTSASLLVYALAFAGCSHLFVVVFEEPVLKRTFGHAYEEYCRNVGRWWPRM